ncbi:MAG: emp24/gp25L/p24 family protein, partial [Thermoplasmatales archaeon]|nr:emp24/gp25L/p24 family protein [Thermoplasmatales archaeon]
TATESVVIPSDMEKRKGYSCKTDDKIDVSFQVTSPSGACIEFYITDGYDKYQHYEAVAQGTFTFYAPHDGTYEVVLSNYNAYDVTVSYEIEAYEKTGGSTSPPSTLISDSTLVIILVLVMVSVIAIVGIVMFVRGKKQRAQVYQPQSVQQQYQQPPPMPQQPIPQIPQPTTQTPQIQYCPSCGKQLQSDWQVCGYCGKKVGG